MVQALSALTVGRSAGVGNRSALAGNVATATVLPVMSKNSTEQQIAIELTLAGGELSRARIPPGQLVERGMGAVRQVVGAAEREDALDQLVGQASHVGLAADGFLLREEQHGREPRLRRVREHAVPIGVDEAQRDVEQLQVTALPSASSIVRRRTVLPQPLNGTGQPWALTANVLATPKSLFDCITAGEKPIASSRAITVDQRVPAATR